MEMIRSHDRWQNFLRHLDEDIDVLVLDVSSRHTIAALSGISNSKTTRRESTYGATPGLLEWLGGPGSGLKLRCVRIWVSFHRFHHWYLPVDYLPRPPSGGGVRGSMNDWVKGVTIEKTDAEKARFLIHKIPHPYSYKLVTLRAASASTSDKRGGWKCSVTFQ